MSKKSESEKRPFRLGDVCKYVGKEDWKSPLIIGNCDVSSVPVLQYDTSVGAWIPHDDLELIEESSVKSRAELFRINEEENAGIL